MRVGRGLILIIIPAFLVVGLVKLFWEGKWDGTRRFTLTINSSPLLLFSIEPRSERAIVLTVPQNTFLEVPFGYGKYLVSSVFRLGELDPKRGGGVLLEKAVEQSLGILVDGYISPKSSDPFMVTISNPADIGEVKKKYFAFSSLPNLASLFFSRRNYTTNLSFADLIKLWIKIRNLRIDKIAYLNLEDKGVLKEVKLADGTNAYYIDEDVIDMAVGQNFEDFSIRAENVSWKIVNASDQDRLATLVARLMKNLGANVLVKETAPEVEKNICLVKVKISKFKRSVIVSRLKSHYQCEVGEDNALAQTDAELILGEDFVR